MKKFALVLGLLTSVSAFATTASADLPASTYGHKIWRAKVLNLASKTEVRDIENCNMEIQYPCTEEVAIERAPVLVVDVAYSDAFNQLEGQEKFFVSFNLPAADAGKKLSLSVKKAERTIQVVDVRNSHLCRVTEAGEEQGCKEEIAYKPATTIVKEVTVSAN